MTSWFKNHLTRRVVVLILALTPCVDAWAADKYGSFYINEALVHFIRPENDRKGVSVVMIPGLNLSSYIYLTTPDGRPGWAQQFADDGYDVYVINDPDYDFSRGFSVAPWTVVPTIGAPPAEPSSTQAWQQDIWSRWGFGSSQGVPYADTRFPTASFVAFAANYPYLRRGGASYSGAIIALLDQIGPSLLMAHSAGGPQAVTAAKARPTLVPSLILIEPTSPPVAADFPVLSGISLIGVYGDYINTRNQRSRKIATELAAALHVQNGGKGKVYSLPEELSIFGNTHLMMQDNNSAFIADLILDWLAASDNATAQPTSSSRLINFSVLTSINSPGDTFTLGYVVGGSGTTGTKPLLIRAVGPSLGPLGISGTLDDPKIELFSSSTKTGENDNWGGSALIATAMAGVGAFAYMGPTSRDAAALLAVASGDNSVKVSAVGTGRVIAEIYDATPPASFTTTTPRLVNGSVLGQLGTGLTVGFVVGGSGSKNVLIRAIGPTLGSAFGVGGAVSDPQLTLNSGQIVVASNDNWGGGATLATAFSSGGAFTLPATSRDAAIVARLIPGNYTVQVSGIAAATGTILVEIYELP